MVRAGSVGGHGRDHRGRVTGPRSARRPVVPRGRSGRTRTTAPARPGAGPGHGRAHPRARRHARCRPDRARGAGRDRGGGFHVRAPRWVRPVTAAGQSSVGPEAAVDLVVAVGGGDDGGASAEELGSAPAEATSTMEGRRGGAVGGDARAGVAAGAGAEPEPEPEPVGLALGAFGYVALSVRDRDHSLAWYAMVLGFEEVSRQDSAARRSSVMRFGSGGFSVGLVERVPSDGQPFDRTRTGLDHLAFAVRSRATSSCAGTPD